MLRSPHEKRLAWQNLRICAPVSTSIGSRLRSNGKASPTFHVEHPRVSTRHQSDDRSALPLLSQLLFLRAHRDRALRGRASVLVRPAPPSTLSPIRSRRLRPCAG